MTITRPPVDDACRRARERRWRGFSMRGGVVLVAALATCIIAPAPAQGGQPPATRAASDPAWHSARTAFLPFFGTRRAPVYESDPATVVPHPAVARIIVPEGNATAFGSGTLVDVREKYGLVVTNWHVVRDSKGVVKVEFPCGFRSHARPLKVDSNWDLAALVIWRPPIAPVQLASQPPVPGDLLTIHGYGKGQYRIATGRCTTYYAPRMNFPHEMVELDVEARQGDSGGPIFNQQGELAGVLFGAGQGTTLGSYAPRVSNFLATLAPNIGEVHDDALVAIADRPAPRVEQPDADDAKEATYPSSPWAPPEAKVQQVSAEEKPTASPAVAQSDEPTQTQDDIRPIAWFDSAKSALALVGLLAIALQMVKLVR